jgi:hypothetical protein
MSFKFPKTDYSKYDSINTEGPYKKILEFNNNLTSINDPRALDNSQLEHIRTFLETIKKIQFYHTSSFNDNEIVTFTRTLSRWPIENLIPYLDSFRMYLLHPKSNELFMKIGGGVQELSHFLEILKNASEIHKILIVRILNNMFLHESSRVFMNDKRQDILDGISFYLDTENKNLRNSIIRLLYK